MQERWPGWPWMLFSWGQPKPEPRTSFEQARGSDLLLSRNSHIRVSTRSCRSPVSSWIAASQTPHQDALSFMTSDPLDSHMSDKVFMV